MSENGDRRWLHWLLSAVVLLLAVIAVELSALVRPIEPRAWAQVLPDSARQRQESISEQVKMNANIEKVNANLDRILQHLRTQTIKVKVVGTDKDSKNVPAPKPGVERKD